MSSLSTRHTQYVFDVEHAASQDEVPPIPVIVPFLPEGSQGAEQTSQDRPADRPTRSTIVNIGGMRVPIDEDGDHEVQVCKLSKFERARLSHKHLQSFEAEVVKKRHPKFALLSPSDLTNQAKMKESHTLFQLIRSVEENHIRFDIGDVFTIVFPLNIKYTHALKMETDTRCQTKNLYKEYATLTQHQVSGSCYWYNVYASGEARKIFRDNNRLTYEYMIEHVSQELHEKVMETYIRYSAEYRGGPLYFKIMMDTLVTNTETLSEQIIKEIKGYKISDIPGENISTAVSHLRSHCGNLFNIRKLPSDIELTLLAVYQTTSVAKFNALFAGAEQNKRFKLLDPSEQQPVQLYHLNTIVGDRLQEQQLTLYANCNKVHDIAQTAAVQMRKEWNVPSSKGATFCAEVDDPNPPRAITFKASALLNKCCWNCGGEGHILSKCPKPTNEKQIELNRKAFYDAKKKSTGQSGAPSAPQKFRPPTDSENNRRVIDGTPMFYQQRTKRWVRDKFPPSANVSESQAPEGESNKGTEDSSARKAQIQAHLTDAARSFGQMMQTLKNELE